MIKSNPYKISYIISTKNRLPFLKILEKHIFLQLNQDEELVVVDGESTDGSKEYLQDLYDRKVIHKFVSEPDINQAHGWNKALLMARGETIKKIIDDDVFDLGAIRKCANYMEMHPEVDLCISDCLQCNLNSPDDISSASRKQQFLRWKNGEVKSFTFSDVYLLIRRSSLSRFGLFDTQFRMLDWEYALRCSYLGAKIAYYTGCLALCVSTPGNVTSTTSPHTLKYEGEIGKIKYEYAGDAAEISAYSKLKILAGKTLERLKLKRAASAPASHKELKMEDTYSVLYQKLSEKNLSQTFDFI